MIKAAAANHPELRLLRTFRQRRQNRGLLEQKRLREIPLFGERRPLQGQVRRRSHLPIRHIAKTAYPNRSGQALQKSPDPRIRNAEGHHLPDPAVSHVHPDGGFALGVREEDPAAVLDDKGGGHAQLPLRHLDLRAGLAGGNDQRDAETGDAVQRRLCPGIGVIRLVEQAAVKVRENQEPSQFIFLSDAFPHRRPPDPDHRIHSSPSMFG